MAATVGSDAENKKPELQGKVGWKKTLGIDVSLFRVTSSSKVSAV
jgi:hypothetical protein